jgi:hypothetical protein
MGMAWLIECRVRVACLPLGVAGCSPVFASMIAAMRRAGILPVAPVGNRGAGQALAPACYPEVLAVGALDAASQVPAFSGSLNPPGTLACLKPDLVSPGVDLPCALPGGRFATSSGSSMACALLAGAACLLFEACPQASAMQVEQALLASCTPLSPGQSHLWGRGLADLPAALARLEQLMAGGQEQEIPPFTRLEKSWVDPRLLRQLDLAGSGHIEAILVAQEAAGAGPLDERGPAGVLLDEITRALGEQPRRLHFLPAAGIAIVLATAPFLRAALAHPSLSVASAADAGLLDSS